MALDSRGINRRNEPPPPPRSNEWLRSAHKWFSRSCRRALKCTAAKGKPASRAEGMGTLPCASPSREGAISPARAAGIPLAAVHFSARRQEITKITCFPAPQPLVCRTEPRVGAGVGGSSRRLIPREFKAMQPKSRIPAEGIRHPPPRADQALSPPARAPRGRDPRVPPRRRCPPTRTAAFIAFLHDVAL